jgi:branched-chain amino acid transport system substrate-binding protein
VNQDFVKKYNEKYGTDPDSIAALSYDVANLMLEVIRQVGVDDPARMAVEFRHEKWNCR